jgi:hypothetical protein
MVDGLIDPNALLHRETNEPTYNAPQELVEEQPILATEPLHLISRDSGHAGQRLPLAAVPQHAGRCQQWSSGGYKGRLL